MNYSVNQAGNRNNLDKESSEKSRGSKVRTKKIANYGNIDIQKRNALVKLSN